MDEHESSGLDVKEPLLISPLHALRVPAAGVETLFLSDALVDAASNHQKLFPSLFPNKLLRCQHSVPAPHLGIVGVESGKVMISTQLDAW